MYPTVQTTDPAKALKQNLAINTKVIDVTEKNQELVKAVENTKSAAKYSIASSFASMIEAQAGVQMIAASKSQYAANKSLINRNIANTQAVMMENLQDTMSQLDSVSAAKNVDINSQAIRAIKERGLIDMGKDFADMTTQGSLQKSALDLQYSMQMSEAKTIRNKTLGKGLDNIFEMAEFLL